MNQLRKDYLTDEKVLIATIRSIRPKGLPEEMAEKPGFECPLCPGKEMNLAPAKQVYLKDEAGNIVSKVEGGDTRETSWLVKVLDNKFPVFESTEQPSPVEDKGLTYIVPFGVHELIIDTPNHTNYFHNMNSDSVKLLFQVYRDRFNELGKDERAQFISISKNHGPKSGGTLLHPHSHIISSNILPDRVIKELNMLEGAEKCLIEDVIARERNSPRFVFEEKSTIVISPYAAMFPYEVWVIPKSHVNNINKLKDEEFIELALTLRDVCRAFNCVLENPSYNFIINQTVRNEKYHMYIRVFPRFYFETGFEISLGLPVNEVAPEKAAEEIRRFFGG
ncbi:MAG: HIT domain-containing protein [Candidatus Odinarchaeota archaeon]